MHSLMRTRLIILSAFVMHKSKIHTWANTSLSKLFNKLMLSSILGIQTAYCLETTKDFVFKARKLEVNEESLIVQSDEYFKVGQFQESYKVLQLYEESKNSEILWRLARALYNMSKEKGVKSHDRNQMIEKGYLLIMKALEFDQNNYAVHKWMAILLDAKHSQEGITSRLEALPTFKKHLMKAMELNPNDATTIYILGQYCYNLAGMPWYQRKIAASLFAELPEATFEEALYYFSLAEEVEPNFYSLNLLMLGKTYLQLKKIDAARYWLKCASAYPIRTDEDKMVRKEAEDLLKKYPPVKYKTEPKRFGTGKKHNNNE